ncbi:MULTISPECIES: hypothetical protein [Methylobacterium]|uniref:hypothetical protein n=1 Tax=Methylobacterium TaxID=407 RepID=UPI0012E80F0D|nr:MULTISPECIES: hypothetical protein [Methylobacterium]
MPLNIGSNGWDIDVEAAFDAVLEAAEHMVKTQQIPGVMSTWASGEALVKSFKGCDIVDNLCQDQRDELADCIEGYYERKKEDGTVF